MWKFCHKCLLTLVFGFLMIAVQAQTQQQPDQPKNNSPISRFGLGDILNPNLAVLRATPGFTNSYRDAFHFNLQNPASLGHLQYAVFDLGLYGKNSKWSGTNEEFDTWSGNLSNLNLGFTLNNPINELLDREARDFSWGMAIGLNPYTLVGYNVETTGEIPAVGKTSSSFIGEGGTYQMNWSNGIRYKNFAVGLNLAYFFGKIENRRNVTFDDLRGGYEDRFVDDFSLSGFTYRLGLMYDIKLSKEGAKEPKILTLGVTGNSTNSLNTNTSQFYQRFNKYYILSENADTISNVRDVKGNATLPAQFGIGATYTHGYKWKMGVNYDFSAWSKYRNDAKPESLKDSWRMAVSGEITPDYASYNSFLKRISYRFGGFVGKDPRSVKGEQIGEYGITLGMGIPVHSIRNRGTGSFINIAIELGQSGANTSLKETFAQFTLGFSLYDSSWFYKRKFD